MSPAPPVRKKVNCAGTSSLANGLVANQGLTALDLGRNGISAPGVQALAGALRSHGALSSLNVAGNELVGGAGSAAVAELVACAQGLKKLSGQALFAFTAYNLTRMLNLMRQSATA